MKSLDWKFWILLAVAAILDISGDLLVKWWADTNRWLGIVGGMVLYVGSLLLFAHMLRRAELGVILALWVGVATVLMALAGWWIFGESLSIRQLGGIGLVIIGVVLLQLP